MRAAVAASAALAGSVAAAFAAALTEAATAAEHMAAIEVTAATVLTAATVVIAATALTGIAVTDTAAMDMAWAIPAGDTPGGMARIPGLTMAILTATTATPMAPISGNTPIWADMPHPTAITPTTGLTSTTAADRLPPLQRRFTRPA